MEIKIGKKSISLGFGAPPKKKYKFTAKVDEKGMFEFISMVNEDNSVPDYVIDELKPYLRRYKLNKNIHYHLYGGTLFFGATTEHGAFVCIYCEASKMPLQLILKDGIRMQDYRQIIGESDRQQKVAAKKVYI